MELKQGQIAQMKMTKAHFPYRVISGCLHPETKEFFVLANKTRRQANGFIRNGYMVWELN